MIAVFNRMEFIRFKIEKFFIVFKKFVKKTKGKLLTFYTKWFISFYVPENL